MLPSKFTLSQLQYIYEILLDEKLDKRNFRKNISKISVIKKTKEKQEVLLISQLIYTPTKKKNYNPSFNLTFLIYIFVKANKWITRIFYQKYQKKLV